MTLDRYQRRRVGLKSVVAASALAIVLAIGVAGGGAADYAGKVGPGFTISGPTGTLPAELFCREEDDQRLGAGGAGFAVRPAV